MIKSKKNSKIDYFIEVRETTLMEKESENDIMVNFSNLIYEDGLELAIDDFGVKYSSLNRLFECKFSIIKIDMSFIRKLTEPNYPSAKSIVQAIIYIAHSMSLDVVAEGVETEEQAKILKELGCNIIQGYYYYKPMPFDELVHLIQIRDS